MLFKLCFTWILQFLFEGHRRVYPSLRLWTCQSLNLLTLVWRNKNNRQIKEAKCHRQIFKSFCSSPLCQYQSCKRRMGNWTLLNILATWYCRYFTVVTVNCTIQWLIDTDQALVLLCLSFSKGDYLRGQHEPPNKWCITASSCHVISSEWCQ